MTVGNDDFLDVLRRVRDQVDEDGNFCEIHPSIVAMAENLLISLEPNIPQPSQAHDRSAATRRADESR